jgi:hypothetical protein
MPLELQDLSPKPDFDALDAAQKRIPKLGVRGRCDGSPVATPAAPFTPIVPAPFTEKESKETLVSSNEGTLSPPSPTSPTGVAPWEKAKLPDMTPDTSNTPTPDGRLSCEIAAQPFRPEVRLSTFFRLNLTD